MPQHISATDTRKRLRAVLDDVARNGAEYVIERRGRPTAAIIPIQVYEKHMKERDDAFGRIEALRRHLTQITEVEDLEQAIDEATVTTRRNQK